MALFAQDTRPEVRRILIEGYRRMTPAQKLARVTDLSATTRQLAAAGIRKRHPEATEHEVQFRLAALVLGSETMLRVFGWEASQSSG